MLCSAADKAARARDESSVLGNINNIVAEASLPVDDFEEEDE